MIDDTEVEVVGVMQTVRGSLRYVADLLGDRDASRAKTELYIGAHELHRAIITRREK